MNDDVADLALFRSRRRAGAGTSADSAHTDPAHTDPIMGGPLPRGTVTFFLAEAAGGRTLLGRRDLLASVTAAHGGVCPLDHGGDATFVAAFDLAPDAAAAAVLAQSAFSAGSGPAGCGPDGSVRMALHAGDGEVVGGRYLAGLALSRGGGLRRLAHGGQILVSGPAADLLADGLPAGAGLRPMGLHRLRDLDHPLRVFQLTHPDLPALFPPLRTADAATHRLPAQLTGFVGREGDRADLLALLAAHRLVTLAGTGGTGKTRLAAQAAADAAEAYPGGLAWADLAPLSDPDAISWAVLAALGLGYDRGQDPVERIAGYLAGRRFLLVLDNCEHVVGAAADTVDRLLRACPGLGVLATSREPLGVPGEVIRRVAPMAVPAGHTGPCPAKTPPPGGVTPDSLADYEGVRLFCERARDARPSFRLDATNAPVVAAICARLDGLPLALELAAARIRALSPERVLAGLDDRFRLLTGGSAVSGVRQQTLQASVEWSHDLLTAPEQALFRRLAVFAGWFDLDAAEAVGSGPDVAALDVPALLGDLVDKSLVLFDGERYGLLQTLAAFAGERLADAGESTAAAERHAAHFLERAEAAAELMSRQLRPRLLVALERDHPNLRAALDWATGRARIAPEPAGGSHRTALRLVVALGSFWHLHGHFTEGLAWHRRVLAEVPAEPSPIRCRAIGGLGYLSVNCGDLGGGFGIAELAEAVGMSRELAEPGLAARPLCALGATQVFGLPGDAEQTLADAVGAARAGGEGWDLWCALWWLAFYWIFTRNRPALAGPVLAEVDAIARQAERDACVGWGEVIWLQVAFHDGRLAEARTSVEVALAIGCEVGDPVLEAYAVGFGTDVLVGLGAYPEAETLGRRTAERLHRSLDACRQGWVEVGLARVALARGDLAGALREAEAVEETVRAYGVPLFVGWLCHVRGRVALERGDLARARAAFAEASALADGTAVPWSVAYARHHEGLLAFAAGDLAAAGTRLRAALDIDVEHGFRGRATDTLEALAAVAAAAGSYAEAARFLGAAAALREATGTVRAPLDAAAYAATEGAVRKGLGDDEFGRLTAQGADAGLAGAAGRPLPAPTG